MQIFRSYIAPFLIILVFFIAMIAVSARIFLPNDMLAPAPIEDVEQSLPSDSSAQLPHQPLEQIPDISILIKGVPQDLGTA